MNKDFTLRYRVTNLELLLCIIKKNFSILCYIFMYIMLLLSTDMNFSTIKFKLFLGCLLVLVFILLYNVLSVFFEKDGYELFIYDIIRYKDGKFYKTIRL